MVRKAAKKGATAKGVTTQEMEDRYSRQTLTYGKGAMSKISGAKILITCRTGFSGPALELAKCVIMAGTHTVSLHSRNFVLTSSDLSSNYYCDESDLVDSAPGSASASASVSRAAFEKMRSSLASLNPSVVVDILDYNMMLDVDNFGSYDCICFVDYTSEEYAHFNTVCRERDVKSIFLCTHGLMGSVFCDFLNHSVTDKDGEPVKSGVIEQIKDYTFTTAAPHRLSTGDAVKFGSRVLSLESDTSYCVKVVDALKFQVTSYKAFDTDNERIVYAKHAPTFQVVDQIPQNLTYSQQKIEYVRPHKPYTEFVDPKNPIPIDDHLVRFDTVDWMRPYYLMAFHRTISINPPTMDLYEAIFRQELKRICSFAEYDQKVAVTLWHTHRGRVVPIDAITGAVSAQEVIKSVCNKYEPINQFMYFDGLNVLPSNYLETRMQNLDDYADQGDRYDGQTRIFGKLSTELLPSMSAFVVGSGAVGCEHIKNLAMMGVATAHGTDAKVVVTDMDSIELSNLNRQFLFRSSDIGESKSITACKAARAMNPDLNIEAHTRKVGRETENVYDSNFFDGMHVVLNALDNVEARRYMDGRCVDTKTPLLECGTLGTIGSIQAVVPKLTESYSSFEDADQGNAIPVCTLKLFPSTFEHVVEYARSAFETHFNVPFATYRKVLQDPDSLKKMDPTDLNKAHHEIMMLIANYRNFKYCIRRAFDVFHQIFRDPIAQIIRKYPQDHTDDDGKLFWSGTKIFPTVIDFDANNDMHMKFIISFANIWADCLRIPRNRRYAAKSVGKYKEFIATLDVPEEIRNDDIDLDEDAKEEDGKAEAVEIDTAKLIGEIGIMIEKSKATLSKAMPMDFEKDDDTNFHVDMLWVLSELRSQNYRIASKDRLAVKGIAGKIIPAIATTTSIVSALVSLELYKIAYSQYHLNKAAAAEYSTCERYRYGTFNLGTSMYAFGESVPVRVETVGKHKYTIWDTDTFDADTTINDVVEHYTDIACGDDDDSDDDSNDSDTDDTSDDKSSESLIDDPLVVQSIYLGDEVIYDKFIDPDDETLRDVISRIRVRGKDHDDDDEEEDDGSDAQSRDYTFLLTLTPDEVGHDLDKLREQSVNIKFGVRV